MTNDDTKTVYLAGIGLRTIPNGDHCVKVKQCSGCLGAAVREFTLRPSGEYTKEGYEIWR